MSQISKCYKVTVILTYWGASGEVSELSYKSLLSISSKRSYCIWESIQFQSSIEEKILFHTFDVCIAASRYLYQDSLPHPESRTLHGKRFFYLHEFHGLRLTIGEHLSSTMLLVLSLSQIWSRTGKLKAFIRALKNKVNTNLTPPFINFFCLVNAIICTMGHDHVHGIWFLVEAIVFLSQI